jgi:HK97 family phage portal protein
VGWLTRSLRPPPPDDITPNPNDPASVPPSTVGPDQLVEPGDPHGVIIEEGPPPGPPPPTIIPSAWSGYPAEWWPPYWNGHVQQLSGFAWLCVNVNADALTTMSPYLVNPAPSLDAGWLVNPDPDLYSSWGEFLHALAFDFQMGEAFVYVTARYSSGWPARFHVVPPWSVEVELGRDGMREYKIGEVPVSGEPGGDLLHLRYVSTVDDAHGHGPLEAGATSVVAAQTLTRYAATVASTTAPSVLMHPQPQNAEQSADLKARWVAARQSAIGEPAVLSGGITWEPAQMSPRDMALIELLQMTKADVASLLGVPPAIVNVPTGDSLTYANVSQWTDMHWRIGLKPKAKRIADDLSGFLLPRGTMLEFNEDAYVAPDPLQRAQTAQIYASIRDEASGRTVLTVEEIREAERFTGGQPIAEVIR